MARGICALVRHNRNSRRSNPPRVFVLNFWAGTSEEASRAKSGRV